MNYAIFRIEKQTILKSVMSLKKQGFHTFFILDEATAFKALNTQISKAVAAITPVVNKKLGLTATLMKGKLDEIYGIFKNVGISLCSSKAVFEKNYCILWQHPTIWYLKRIKGFKNVELFKEKVDPYSLILRKSDIAADLPPFQIQKRFLELSTEQESLLKEIYSGALALTEEGFDYENIENNDSQKILEALTEVGYVKRALTSPQIVAPDRFYENSPKTDEILRMLKEEFVDEKIVIYTPSKKYLKILCETIRDCKDLDTYYRKPLEISGDISADVRYQQMKDFSNNNIHNIMVLNNAGSEAINLQAASVLIITSLPDTWGQLIQIVGRISRIGSVHSSLLLVFLLHEDSQDFDEYCILQKQGVLFQAIHGDVEKGLLDTSVLRGAEHEGIPDEEFVSRSVAHLLIGTRKRRADKYSSSFVK
jgi:SNF2 family DNA or RNA helicase